MSYTAVLACSGVRAVAGLPSSPSALRQLADKADVSLESVSLDDLRRTLGSW